MKPALIAVDGIDADGLLTAAARRAIGSDRAGISRWDASGVFQELSVADAEAGAPSARVLLLLYAADLAFRLRWEIRPALAEGRSVAAAPYLSTAFAFGRAAGVPVGWLSNLFRFAPRPGEQKVVYPSSVPAVSSVDGFVGFSCRHMASANGLTGKQVLERTVGYLREADRKKK